MDVATFILWVNSYLTFPTWRERSIKAILITLKSAVGETRILIPSSNPDCIWVAGRGENWCFRGTAAPWTTVITEVLGQICQGIRALRDVDGPEKAAIAASVSYAWVLLETAQDGPALQKVEIMAGETSYG